MHSIHERLINTLATLPTINRLWVAYSGGVDSHVLLHALAEVRISLSISSLHAIHIDHQINPQSSQWDEHCRKVCEQLNVEYVSHKVDVDNKPGDSLEAKARDTRYAAIISTVASGDVVVTAQHQDDQAETLMLQLLRGAGPHGLASMPEQSQLGEALMLRPLLGVTRDEILEYAKQYDLEWVEDQSNEDTRFDRNFLRQDVIPLLKQRWPSMGQTLSRSARLCADAAELLDECAATTLKQMDGARKQVDGARKQTDESRRDCISAEKCQALSDYECKSLIRYWLRSLDLPLPSYVQLEQIVTSVLRARSDSEPLVSWKGAEIRRYGDEVYALSPLVKHDPDSVYEWDVNSSLKMSGIGKLIVETAEEAGLDIDKLPEKQLSVRFRRGGEKCKLLGHPQSQTLKNLFQQWRVPPWQRDRVPLLYAGEEIVAVVGYALCEGYGVKINSELTGEVDKHSLITVSLKTDVSMQESCL